MSVEKEIRKILGEATPAAARAKQDLVRSGLGHDKNAAATMAALKDPEAAMQNPAKRELLLKVMQDLLDVVVNDPSMVTKTKSALRKEEVDLDENVNKTKQGYDAWTKHLTQGGPRPKNPHAAGQGMHEWEKGAENAYNDHMDKAHNDRIDKKKSVKEELEEKLVGRQKKIDINKNGKLDAEDFKKLRTMKKEEYVSNAQRKAVWASRNDAKEAMKRKTKKEGLGEGIRAIHPSEIAGNPKAYDVADVKKAYYHKNVSSDDKKALERHLDRHYGIRNWRKPVKEEVQIDEMNDYKVQVTHKNKDGKEDTMIHHLTGVKHRKAAGYIAIDRHRDMLKKKGIEPHAFSARIVESVTTNYDMIKGQSKNKAPTQKLATDYKLATKKTQKEEIQIDEAGPFSYGAKPPRKGSIAYNAAMKRKEQEKDPVEIARINKIGNKNHMVGTAKVIHKEETQIDELKKSTLASYVSKAAGAYGRDKQLIGRESPDGTVKNARPEMKRAVKNRLTGINRAAEKLAKEELQIDEMMSPAETYKKLAVKHLRDSMDKNATQKQRDYAKMMNKRALEASKMDNHTDALNHYRGMAKEEVQMDEAFPTVADARKRAKEAMKSKFEKKKISTGTIYQRKHKDKEKEEKDEKGVMDEAVKADKNVPFDPPYSKKHIAIPGKQGIGPSTARHLARLALAKQLKNKNNK